MKVVIWFISMVPPAADCCIVKWLREAMSILLLVPSAPLRTSGCAKRHIIFHFTFFTFHSISRPWTMDRRLWTKN